MTRVELQFGAATHVGQVRAHNEDAYLAEPPVFVVADGMGGHRGGEIASAIVVEEFARLARDGFDDRNGAAAVDATLRSAQRRIREYGAAHAERPDRWHAGTTVAAALLVADHEAPKWLLANLGDSRIYKLSSGRFDQVSVDHSVVQELIDAGVISPADAATHPRRHVVTRALNGRELPNAEYFVIPLTSAERLVLCSDGVSGMLDDAELGRFAAEAPDPQDAADRIIEAAVAAGGEDNATAVVVDVVGLTGGHDSGTRRTDG